MHDFYRNKEMAALTLDDFVRQKEGVSGCIGLMK